MGPALNSHSTGNNLLQWVIIWDPNNAVDIGTMYIYKGFTVIIYVCVYIYIYIYTHTHI